MSVPISPDTPDIQYGAGVGVYRTSSFGPAYGHGGWIPGYSSKVRAYLWFNLAAAQGMDAAAKARDSLV